jgi:hypothetical protein
VYPTGYKKGALRPRLFKTKTLIKTNAAWVRKQRRDKQAKHVELHEGEQLSQAVA